MRGLASRARRPGADRRRIPAWWSGCSGCERPRRRSRRALPSPAPPPLRGECRCPHVTMNRPASPKHYGGSAGNEADNAVHSRGLDFAGHWFDRPSLGLRRARPPEASLAQKHRSMAVLRPTSGSNRAGSAPRLNLVPMEAGPSVTGGGSPVYRPACPLCLGRRVAVVTADYAFRVGRGDRKSLMMSI